MTPTNLTECLAWLDEVNGPNEGPIFRYWIGIPDGPGFAEWVTSRVAECLRGHLAEKQQLDAVLKIQEDVQACAERVDKITAKYAPAEAIKAPAPICRRCARPAEMRKGWEICEACLHRHHVGTGWHDPIPAPTQAEGKPPAVPGPAAFMDLLREICDQATMGGTSSEYSQRMNTTMSQVPSKLIAALEKAIAAPVPEVSPAPTWTCEWYEDDPDSDMWQTGCGKDFAVSGGKPGEEGWRYCHACAGEIVVTTRKDFEDPTPTDPANGRKEAQP